MVLATAALPTDPMDGISPQVSAEEPKAEKTPTPFKLDSSISIGKAEMVALPNMPAPLPATSAPAAAVVAAPAPAPVVVVEAPKPAPAAAAPKPAPVVAVEEVVVVEAPAPAAAAEEGKHAREQNPLPATRMRNDLCQGMAVGVCCPLLLAIFLVEGVGEEVGALIRICKGPAGCTH